MSNHTPGPWKADLIRDCIADAGDYYSYWNIRAENKGSVCQIHDSGHDEIDDANARLIAAAPELLTMVGRLGFVLSEVADNLNLDLDGTCIQVKSPQGTGAQISLSELFGQATALVKRIQGEENE